MRRIKKIEKEIENEKSDAKKNKILIQIVQLVKVHKKVKNVKTIIQIGKFYLGKEVLEECKLCSEKTFKTSI